LLFSAALYLGKGLSSYLNLIVNSLMQRSGSGARSDLYLSILDPDPSITKQKIKKILYNFLSLRNDGNVPSKRGKKLRKNIFLLAS
jgi:hypothetical protein